MQSSPVVGSLGLRGAQRLNLPPACLTSLFPQAQDAGSPAQNAPASRQGRGGLRAEQAQRSKVVGDQATGPPGGGTHPQRSWCCAPLSARRARTRAGALLGMSPAGFTVAAGSRARTVHPQPEEGHGRGAGDGERGSTGIARNRPTVRSEGNPDFSSGLDRRPGLGFG